MLRKCLVVAGLLMALTIGCVSANSLTLGVLDAQGGKLTTVEYAVAQPEVGNFGSEATFGLATAVDDVMGQDSDVQKLSVGIGLTATKSIFTLGAGYNINWIDSGLSTSVNPGMYGKLRANLGDVLFAQVKYTAIADTDDAEGWEYGAWLNWKF